MIQNMSTEIIHQTLILQKTFEVSWGEALEHMVKFKAPGAKSGLAFNVAL